MRIKNKLIKLIFSEIESQAEVLAKEEIDLLKGG
ncbi:hypothetical protein CCYN49044_60002 [Capnocytophaga cynodegmi]|nr:hypothetical protein CCYN49044_60002 [Capnocytophaga cynodegmi]